MWRFIWLLLGWSRIRLTGASPEWALNRLASGRIAFRDTQKIDELTVETSILSRDVPRAAQAAQKGMCDLAVLRRRGAPVLLGSLKKRYVLLLTLPAVLIALIVLPKFVWFYEVSGNETVPSELILQNLEELGVGFGTYGPDIHPQWIKNHMLVRIPKLQWITVTQNGAVAQVVVRERPETEPVSDRKTPGNVLASRAGILTRVSVLEGNSLCRTGDIVKKGQLLVSGYTDLQNKTQVSPALAEIYARTWRRETAVLPQTELVRVRTGKRRAVVSVLWGRHRTIIFGKGGADASDCDKITKIYPFTLPGGFSLPVAIEIAHISDYDTIEKEMRRSAAGALLQKDVRDRTLRDMIAGRILQTDEKLEKRGGRYELHATLACEEMIARMVDAEIFRNEGTP